MAANKEIVKDCRSAVQLEQELQISYAQRGVAILDVYSSEWGQCRAIAETFRRILTDSGDGVHLRFLAVECNSILASLKNPEDQKNPQRPKNLDAIRDTLPEGWQHILEERCGQSKPFFLFYKEGKRVAQIEGVNTPHIRATVKDLCSVKTPASEFISNPRLQELWDEQFNPEESDVAYDKFLKGLLAALKYSVSLNDAEKALLGEAIAMTKERMVTAEGLQKWMGDDETRTVHQAFLDTLPDYEARASAQAAKDEEERKVREAEAAKKAAEEKAAAEAKQKEEEEEKARRAAQSAQPKGTSADALLEKLAPEGITNASDAAEGSHEHEVRKAVHALPLPTPTSNRFGAHFVSAAEAEEKAVQFNESFTQNARTLKASLREAGVSFKTIAAIRHEASSKVGHEALHPLARTALLLLSSNEAHSASLIGKPVDFAAAVAAQTSLNEGGLIGDVAFHAISTAVTAVPKDVAEFTVSTTGDIVKTLLTTLGGEVALPPMTLLSPDSDSPDRVAVTITGIPMTLALWSAGPIVHCLHWFTKFQIESINPLNGSVTLSYAGLVGDDAFTVKAAAIATESSEDERKCEALAELQALPPQSARATAHTVAEKKEDSPKEEEHHDQAPQKEEAPAVEEQPPAHSAANDAPEEESSKGEQPKEEAAGGDEKKEENAAEGEADNAERPAAEGEPVDEKGSQGSAPAPTANAEEL